MHETTRLKKMGNPAFELSGPSNLSAARCNPSSPLLEIGPLQHQHLAGSWVETGQLLMVKWFRDRVKHRIFDGVCRRDKRGKRKKAGGFSATGDAETVRMQNMESPLIISDELIHLDTQVISKIIFINSVMTMLHHIRRWKNGGRVWNM